MKLLSEVPEYSKRHKKLTDFSPWGLGPRSSIGEIVGSFKKGTGQCEVGR